MFHHLKCSISLYARNLVNGVDSLSGYIFCLHNERLGNLSTIFCYKLLVKINVYVVVNESYLDQRRLLVSC